MQKGVELDLSGARVDLQNLAAVGTRAEDSIERPPAVRQALKPLEQTWLMESSATLRILTATLWQTRLSITCPHKPMGIANATFYLELFTLCVGR